MRKLLAAVLAAIICSPALAGTIGIDVGTWHDRPGLRSSNPGLYYKADSGLAGGAYLNSYGRTSAWAGYQLESGRLGLLLGAATGYPCGGVLPMAVPSVRLGPARISVVPKVLRQQTATAVHLSLEFEL